MTADVLVGALGVVAGIALGYAVRRPFAARPAGTPAAAAAAHAVDEERAARLVGALPFAAFTVDARRRVRVFNAGAQALFGVSGERAAGRAIIEVVPSVEVERMIAAVRSRSLSSTWASASFI